MKFAPFWSGRNAACIQSAFAIPATRYRCDLSLCADNLDVVGRPDQHVIGSAMAAMAAMERALIGVGAHRRDLGLVRSGDRAVRGGRADSDRLCASAERAGADFA